LELEGYIQQHRNFPGVPTAGEVKENGIKLGQMDALLLQKMGKDQFVAVDLFFFTAKIWFSEKH